MEREFDLDNMSCQEIKALIINGKIDVNTLSEDPTQKLLDYETELLFCDGADITLMRAYSRRLEALRGDGLKTKKSTAEIIADGKTTKKRIPKIKLIAVAAILATTVCLGTTTVAEPTYRTLANEYVMNKPVGTTIELDKRVTGTTDVTVAHGEPSLWYDSTEALLAAIDREIYYPTVFAHGKKPVNFLISETLGYKTATISLYDSEVCFTVTFDDKFTEDKVKAEHFDVYEAHGKKFYFDRELKNTAFFFDDGNFYCISTPFRQAQDEIRFLIDNLKKG